MTTALRLASKLGYGLLLWGLIGTQMACAPRISSQINVPNLTGGASAAIGSELGVNIRPMTDKRQNSSFGTVAGYSIKGRGDVSWSVTGALIRSLHAAGIYPKPFVNATISGEVNSWNFSVLQGFPSSHALSDAEISLRVFDTDGQVRYFATYRGNAETSGWFLGTSDMEEILATSMQAAIDQAAGDARLLAAMRSVPGLGGG